MIGAFLKKIAGRQDLALITLLVMVIFMIILPLPTWLVDALIAVNLGVVVLILVVTVYLKNPTSFSTLPAILLFSTLFRLAISISTTRLILVQADAGQIVETFGQFVVGGNMVVGIVVFLIITVVQFVVITKGSERVAEVSARFSLDALPGRQMSIDSDMRAGEIDMSEAKSRRRALQLESEFYGSMDGAMKFVKGDAIAGIIIIFVNILGGIAIGVMQLELSFGEASSIYTVLTVGDGLVSQIPALFMAIASGVVITRIVHDQSSDLGTDISDQIGANPRAMQIAAGVLFLMGFIPGFPTAIFVVLALLLLGASYLSPSGASSKAADPLQGDAEALHLDNGPEGAMDQMAAVLMVADTDLFAELDETRFAELATLERTRLFGQIGVPFPPIRLHRGRQPGHGWALVIEGVPVAEGTIPEGQIRITDDPTHAEILGLAVEASDLKPTKLTASWTSQDATRALDDAGVAYQRPEAVLITLAGELLPTHAQDFLGVHETNIVLSSLEKRYDELVKEAQKAIPIQKIAQVLRRLVEEEVPVRNMRIVLETLVEWGGREKDPDVLAEYTRIALGRQICHRYANENRTLPAYVIDRDIEDVMRDSITVTPAGSALSIDPGRARKFLSVLRQSIGSLNDHTRTPIVLTALDTRRFLKQFLREHGIDCPVMSHKEVPSQYQVQPLAVLSLK